MALFTLLTDFGLEDSYVAEMKAALLAKQPSATIVDITHQIPPFQIEAGAFQLWRAHAHFPKGTWHLAVVDPGVGSARRPIYIQTRDYHFVGPDNGLLRWAMHACEVRERRPAKVFEIPVETELQPTFHGRDLFAPFAAKQSKKKGSRLKQLLQIEGRDFPVPESHGVGWRGEVLSIDHYGNAVTTIPARSREVEATLEGNKYRLASVSHYGAIPDGRAGLVRGSHGLWEIAARGDSAARILKLNIGTRVTVFEVETMAG